MKILVSACLLGLPARYDGTSRDLNDALQLARKHHLIPVCPEQLGGLNTPRLRSTIAVGTGVDVLDGKSRVLDEAGGDVTANFLAGAEAALKLAQLLGATAAILAEYSPSCGVNFIKRDEKVIPGSGVCAALLKRNGIKLFSSQDLAGLLNLEILSETGPRR